MMGAGNCELPLEARGKKMKAGGERGGRLCRDGTFRFRLYCVFSFLKNCFPSLCVLKTIIYRQKYCLGLKIGPSTFFFVNLIFLIFFILLSTSPRMRKISDLKK